VITYIQNTRTKVAYAVSMSPWSTFCNGRIVDMHKISLKEFKTREVAHSPVENRPGVIGTVNIIELNGIHVIRKYIEGLLGPYAYILLTAKAGNLLTKRGNVFNRYLKVSYTVGTDEGYILLIRTSSIKAHSFQEMYQKKHIKPTIDEAVRTIFPRTPYPPRSSSDIKKAVQEVVDNIKISDDYVLSFDKLPSKLCTPNTTSTWGRGTDVLSPMEGELDKPSSAILGSKRNYH